MLNLKPAADRASHVAGVVQWFQSDHLPDGRPRQVSKACEQLVDQLLNALPDTPELTAALRKILEAKDCVVRAALIADHAERLAATP